MNGPNALDAQLLQIVTAAAPATITDVLAVMQEIAQKRQRIPKGMTSEHIDVCESLPQTATSIFGDKPY